MYFLISLPKLTLVFALLTLAHSLKYLGRCLLHLVDCPSSCFQHFPTTNYGMSAYGTVPAARSFTFAATNTRERWDDVDCLAHLALFVFSLPVQPRKLLSCNMVQWSNGTVGAETPRKSTKPPGLPGLPLLLCQRPQLTGQKPPRGATFRSHRLRNGHHVQ